jgi:hypothetical protein
MLIDLKQTAGRRDFVNIDFAEETMLQQVTHQ